MIHRQIEIIAFRRRRLIFSRASVDPSVELTVPVEEIDERAFISATGDEEKRILVELLRSLDSATPDRGDVTNKSSADDGPVTEDSRVITAIES